MPNKESREVARKIYQPEQYTSNNETEQGLAMTHEQASDTLTEGTIDGKIDNVKQNKTLENGQGRDIPRKGY
ncbi:YozQ family protein [Radiobacillus kanasensis]|uniref:YozQ family protein n=1 Tax=Radiobacillus kanasensis TaxID=2844358 RepID=UPI001E580D58|nr:YozQ family protein [Radiobacillus kanasensis]UFT98285.1 YozQ family protein [Radiobacillus kanasensis]